MTQLFAIVAGFATLGVAGIGALGKAQLAAAVDTPSEDCVARIQTAIAAIEAAAADRRVTLAKAQAIKTACGI